MPISESLLPEFDREMASMRRTLERVPEDKLDWRPHAKSGTMGWLAGHVANIPGWGAWTLKTTELDLAPPDGPPVPVPPLPRSRQELLEGFDKNIADARAGIAGASDEQWMQPWSLLVGGEVKFTMPRIAVMRGMIMNHLIHHRAQLGVYLRLNDIPVPAVYGASADEGQM